MTGELAGAPRDLLRFVSLVRTTGDPALQAEAAKLLGEPVGTCAHCGHPVLPGAECGCLHHQVRDHPSASHPIVAVRVSNARGAALT